MYNFTNIIYKKEKEKKSQLPESLPLLNAGLDGSCILGCDRDMQLQIDVNPWLLSEREFSLQTECIASTVRSLFLAS